MLLSVEQLCFECRDLITHAGERVGGERAEAFRCGQCADLPAQLFDGE